MSVIIVHGGAGNWPEEWRARAQEGCVFAAQAGHAVLSQGGSALDAVEQAVNLLEDETIFNAGRGSHVNKAGLVEMDAMIVDGSMQNFGAVAAIRHVSNPISVARLVLEQSGHCMLAGHGATTFAHSHGVPFCRDDELRGTLTPHSGDTVGAVALDDSGMIASATSTGGTRDKLLGRVGDSPLFGCGGYADGRCGVSATGEGESLMRATAASAIASEIRTGKAPELAIAAVIDAMTKRFDGSGGAIAVESGGGFAAYWNTAFMPWAAIDGQGTVHSKSGA